MKADPYKRTIIFAAFSCILIAFICLYISRGIKNSFSFSDNHTDSAKTESDHTGTNPGTSNEMINPEDPDTLSGQSGKKTVYLTFDDGPNFGSDIVMNIAQQENIPVNFFCVGYQFTGEPYHRFFSKTWERMHTQPGVEIYNHGFTHALNNRYEYFYARPDTVVYDFKRAYDSAKYNTMICRANGNNIWRTPTIHHDTYRRYNPAVDKLAASGFTIFGWDNEWFHYKMKLRQTAEQMAAECEKMFETKDLYAPNQLVLLMHDQSLADPVDSASFHQFVKILKAKPGYRFGRVSGYPGLISKN